MRWYAKLADGDVATMTLDELDAAYENGVVDAATLVLAPEATEWAQLGELAGLRESETAPVPAADDSDPLPMPARSRPRWVAPIAFAAVAAATFAAAGFEAHQAGAFSHRPAPAEERSRPAPAPLATGDSRAATALVSAQPPTVQRETEKHAKRNSPPAAPTTAARSEHAEIFTSGGSAHDPLNTDLP